jgi:UDP-N-acetyl-D-mannosaminuronate dehydrogenase
MNSKKNLEERLELHSIEPEEIFEHTTSFYDLIIILNNHPNYKNIKMKQFIQEQINKGSQVVDSWGVMELPDQLTLSNLFIEES